MEKMVVTGIGLRSCLGDLTESWTHLLAQKSGIQLLRPFSKLKSYPLGAIASTPATLADLAQQIVSDALTDAGLTVPLTDCGIVIGSSRACQKHWEELVPLVDRPEKFANFPIPWLSTLPYQAATIAARLIQSQGIVLAPMAACATGIWAIAQGVELIHTGQCQRVIVGAVEAPITPLTLTGFERMGALASTGCYPFDGDREGLVLGEGGAALVLERETLARQRWASCYGRVLGFGLTCDAHHVSAPSKKVQQALLAVKHTLDRSGLNPNNIDYIHAHGTGTILNDRREAGLISSLFPQSTAVSSTKGSTGHTLGASGAMGTAFCLMALKHQQLPPCIGLRRSPFALNFVREARSQPIRHVLNFSFGFGGQNAVLALGKYDS
jgi:3-oxoacyl-[acyl-carrier-protein] synthase II